MIDTGDTLRRATPDDAAALAALIDLAGEGLPQYLWAGMAEAGETALDVGRRRAARETGGFSYRNAVICEAAGQVAGALIGYPLARAPAPDLPADLPALLRPLAELEALAPGTWYINALAIDARHRGRGLGTRLLARAAQLADETGCDAVSLIVSDANTGARRLYLRAGFRRRAARAAVHDGWRHAGARWLLYARPL